MKMADMINDNKYHCKRWQFGVPPAGNANFAWVGAT